MSRAQRRATQGSVRSRRTPVPAKTGGGGGGIRLAPIFIVVVGVAAVAGLIAYLIWQQSQPASDALTGAQAAESDASTALPGEFIDIAEIYGGPYPDSAPHVRQDVTYEEDQGLPPAGGDHWGAAGTCPSDPTDAPPFCGPVPAGFYQEAWEAENLVHNMEHAAIVVWYNTDDETIRDDLKDFGQDNGGLFNVVAFFPEMEEGTIAITGWSRRLTMSVSEYDRDRLQEFFDAHECRFDPENFC